MHEINDTFLAEKIGQDDEQAFRVLYNRYHVQLYYIAKKYLKDPGLAEDAVQDIFVKCWNKRKSLDPARSVKGYLFTMLKNHVLNMIRDRKKEITSMAEIPAGGEPSRNTVQEDIAYKESRQLVEKGLAGLSDRKREIFELKVFNGHSNSEVAEMLDISVRTVKTHYYNGSKFMKAYLKNHADLLVFLMFLFGLSAFL